MSEWVPEGTPEAPSWVVLLFGAIFAAAGIFLLSICIWLLYDNDPEQSWLPVEATVISATDAECNSPEDHCPASYRYEYGGKRYETSQDIFGEEDTARVRKARAEQTAIAVYVDPRDPSRASVSRPSIDGAFVFFAFVFGLASLGVSALAVVLVRRRRPGAFDGVR